MKVSGSVSSVPVPFVIPSKQFLMDLTEMPPVPEIKNAGKKSVPALLYSTLVKVLSTTSRTAASSPPAKIAQS